MATTTPNPVLDKTFPARPMAEHIFLAGFMGTGKSVTGKALARLEGCEFVDLDEEIEKREVMSVTDIFRRKGEPYFRDIEHRELDEVSRGEG